MRCNCNIREIVFLSMLGDGTGEKFTQTKISFLDSIVILWVLKKLMFFYSKVFKDIIFQSLIMSLHETYLYG